LSHYNTFHLKVLIFLIFLYPKFNLFFEKNCSPLFYFLLYILLLLLFLTEVQKLQPSTKKTPRRYSPSCVPPPPTRPTTSPSCRPSSTSSISPRMSLLGLRFGRSTNVSCFSLFYYFIFRIIRFISFILTYNQRCPCN